MRLVARHFNVLKLGDALDRLTAGTLPPRALSITFDDGYADNCLVAAPILKSLGLPATIFVATGFLDGGIMFNDVVRVSIEQTRDSHLDLADIGLDGLLSLETQAERIATFNKLLGLLKYLPQSERLDKSLVLAESVGARLPDDLMMTSQQLLATANQGIDIGAHTVSHPILKNLSDSDAREEITQSRVDLQARLDREVKLFAYPNGKPGIDFTSRDVRLVEEAGFGGAVTTRAGYSAMSTHPFELRRFTPWDRSRWRFMARLLKNYTSD
jgi:peptidoglycan/xylan/chitin deacetylase (PgdA/CDA1 family)